LSFWKICDFSQNKSCQTYLGTLLPLGLNSTNFLLAAFYTKVFCAAFMYLQFGFVIILVKGFGCKAAHKMLVKLTPGGRNWQLTTPH
jgi:hypothetical protein